MSAPQAVKVLMRNFPKSWVAPQDRPGLPTRIQKILCRFGVLLGEPEVFGGVGGDVTAIACFETLNSAEAAVKTLLGADMRTAAEKQAAGNRAPSESERFWVEIQAAAVSSKARPSQIPVAPEAIPEESFVLVRGFPASWTEPQVKYLFVVFGGTSSIRMDASAMQRAAASLNETDECHIYCEYVAGRLERERLEQAAAAAAAAEKQRRRAEKEERRRQKEERRRKHAEEKERQKEAEEERLRQEALERRRQEEERLERLRLEAVEEERLRKQVEEEEEQLRREAEEAEEEERIRQEEEEEKLHREAEEEEQRLQKEAEELQRLRRGEEEFQRKRLLAEEQARAMQELEEQRERELEEQREREREEEEEQKRQEALEEERLREIEALEAQAEEERIRLEEERVEAAKAEAEAERLQKEEAAFVRQRSARRSLDRRDRAHGHHRRDAEKSTSAVRRKRRRSRSSRTRRKERRRRRREASRSRSRSQTEHRKRRARRGRRQSSEKSPKERSQAVEEQQQDVREPSPDVMVNGQGQPLELPQESQVAPAVQASEAVAPSRPADDPLASMDQWQGWSPAQAPGVFARHPDVPGLWQPDPGHAASSMESTAAPVVPPPPPPPAPPPASAPAPEAPAPAPEAAPIQEVPLTSPAAPELAKPEAKASAKSRGTFSMAWGAVPSRAAATVPTPVNLYQQQLVRTRQFQQWQQQQQQVQEHYHLEQERQKRLEEELKVELQQQLQRQIEEKAREEEEKRQQELAEEERRRQQEKERREAEERRKREAEEQERREAEAAAAARQQEEERSRHMHTRQQAGWPEWPPQLPHLQQFRPALYQTGGQMGQARQTHQVHPAHHFAPAEVHQMGHAYPHGHPQAGHLPQAYAPGTASQTIHLTGHPMQTSAQDAHQRQTGDFLSSTAGSGTPCAQASKPDEPEDDAPTEPSASPQAPDNDDADTEAPTEESDYDPFAGQGKEYNPFAEAESAVKEDDGEDEGAFDSLIEMLRAAERGGHSAPSRATEQSQPQRREARPLDTGEQFEKAKPKPKTHYHFNHATQRWEPKVLPPSPPRTEPSRGDRFRETPSWRNAPPSPPRQAPIKLVVAECEAEARADAANSFCSFAQALAVRLALRFESQPKDILVSMSEAGLPAAKDQRSTVKAIMRLCHPDKCKHPDAKRAMQILGPLLS